MLVKFKHSLGSNDAKPLGLDFAKCCRGMTDEVSDAVAAMLIKRGLAEPVEVKAVAQKPAITAPAIETKPAAAQVKQPDKQPHSKGA